jgi:ATP-dependent DNA helicase RecG
MIEGELQNYLKEQYPSEDATCEWKEFKKLRHAFSGSKGSDIISYVSGIANMEGGHLVMGVEDQSLSIVGISDTHNFTTQDLTYRILGKCPNLPSIGLDVQEFVTDDSGKRIWVIAIPKHHPRQPVYAHDKAWQRIEDRLVELRPERKKEILKEPMTVEDWSAQICSDAAIDDLDPEAIDKARENYKNKFPQNADEVDNWDDITFLNKAKITIKGQITRTAIILLGRPEAEHYISPAEAKIRWVLKDTVGNDKDYEIVGCPLLLAVDKIYSDIRNLKYRYIKEESLFPEEVLQYEPYVIREALNNCIAHQDYTLGGRINVIEKEDQLIFTNKGQFIPESVEQVVIDNAPEEYYRNRFLASAMFNLKMVDTVGGGIRKMFNYQKERYFPLPDYDLRKDRVKVVITGKVLDMEFARLLAKTPDLTLREIIILDKVQKQKTITKEEAKHLRDKNLIEGRRPNYYIAADIAKQIGKKAKYTKNKGFQKNYYLELIKKGIEDHNSMSKQDIRNLLWDKLPDVLDEQQKENKVTNLISELSNKRNEIRNKGSRKKPNWVLINTGE